MAEKLTRAVSSGDQVSSLIMTLRATPVLLDTDLAALYGVTTKVLNQAVQRNAERFPSGFKFQLNREEKNELVTNCDRFKKLKHSSALPHAFTEQGVAMISGHIVYHLGASLKDLGNKWFAFSKLDESGLKVMDRLKTLLP